MYLRVLLVVICGVVGCGPIARLFEPQAATMTPQAFTSDPLLRTLSEAVDRSDAAAITAAVNAGADVNSYGSGGYRLLYWAMARGNVEGFEQLLKNGARLDDDYRDPAYLPNLSYRHSVLTQMVANRDTGFLKAALRQGLDPDHAPNEVEKRSLLFFAVSSWPALEILIQSV